MDEIIRFNAASEKIVRLNGQDVILDFSVAGLYGVETREINQAVRNNPKKFPAGYVFETDNKDIAELKSKFLISTGHARRAKPKAFTEKGLYMLATILKGERAVQTTIAIIEAYAKLRELSRAVGELSASPDKYAQKSLMEKSGGLMADLFGDEMRTSETETEFELNFAVLKVKHTVKRKGKQ